MMDRVPFPPMVSPSVRSFAAGLFLVAALASSEGCKNESSGGDDCQPGTELCACVSGQCFSGLVCDPMSNLCVQGGGGSGGSTDREASLCNRLDECNYLEPGVSAMDCTDEVRFCTDDLIQSARQDWQNEADMCLELSNCKNFFECQANLPDCPAVGGGGGGGGNCVADGNPCDFCNGGLTCPGSYFGDGWCDCDCANGSDPDCF